jgi:hypothetical protein
MVGTGYLALRADPDRPCRTRILAAVEERD